MGYLSVPGDVQHQFWDIGVAFGLFHRAQFPSFCCFTVGSAETEIKEIEHYR